MPPEPLRDKTIVVTGVTGQVAEPVAVALAKENRVVGGGPVQGRSRPAAARGCGGDAVFPSICPPGTWAVCPPTPTM